MATEIFRAIGTVALQEEGNIQGRLNEIGTSAESTGGRMGKLSGVFGKVGIAAAGFAAVLGTAVIAGLGSAIKKTDEYNNALGNLKSGSDNTNTSTKQLGETLKNVYKGGYGKDFQDAADAMKLVQQETKASGKALEEYTKKTITISDAMGTDYADSIKTANTLSTEFGISVDQAFELMAQGNAKGLNSSGDMLDVLQEYSVQFAKNGGSAEDFFNTLISGNDKGVFSYDKLADMQKEFSIRAIDGSKATKQAYADLGLSYDDYSQKLAKGGEEGKQAQQEILDSILSIEDPVKRNEVAIALLGTTYEDLGDSGVEALADTNNAIDESANKMEELNKARFDTLGEKFEVIKRKFETNVLLPLGEKLMPVIDGVMTGISELASFGKEKFDALKTVIDEFMKAFSDPTQSVEGVKNALKNLLPEGMEGQIDNIISFVTNLYTNFLNIAGMIKDIFAPQIENIKTQFENLNFEQLIETFNNLKSTFEENILPILQTVAEVVGGTLVVAFTLIMSVVSALVASLPALGATLLSVFDVVYNSIALIVETIIALFTGDFTKVKEVFGDLVDGIVELFKNLWDFIVSFVGGLVDGIVEGFQSLYDTLVGNSIIPDMINAIIEWFKGLPGKIVSAIGSLVSSVGAKFTALKTAVVDKIKQLVSDAKTKFLEIVGKFKEVVGKVKEAVTTKFGEVKTAIIEKVKSIDLKEIGTNIINSLKNGISNGIKALKEKVAEVAKLIPNSIKSFLGISSPSKVMKGIGNDIIKGLTIGLKGTELKSVLTDVSTLIVESFFTVANKVEDYFTSIKNTITSSLQAVKTDAIKNVDDISKVIETALETRNKELFESQKAKDIETASQLMKEALANKDISAFNEAQKLATEAFNRQYVSMTEDEIEKQIVSLLSDKAGLQSLLETYYPDWQDAGQTLGEKLINGLNSANESMGTAISNIINSISEATSISIDTVLSQIDKVEDKYQSVVNSLSVYIEKINALQDKISATTDQALKDSYTSEIANLEKLLSSKASAYGLTYSDGKLYFPNNVQAFASGVRDYTGGLAMVGEEGKELTYLPQGSNVYSNTETLNILNNLAKLKTPNINPNIAKASNKIFNVTLNVKAETIDSVKKLIDLFENIETEKTTRYSL